jgi:uncharacterized protein (TIGR03086 family)
VGAVTARNGDELHSPAMFDLDPPARQVTALVIGVTDDQLAAPTPNPEMSVAVLLEHIRGLSIEFTRAATKANPATGEAPPPPSAEDLPPDWRDQIPSELAALAGAWQLPEAWEGQTTAGGVTFPAEIMGVVAFNELLIHGWDLAVATGQAYRPDDEFVQVSYDFLLQTVDEPESRAEIYGPVVPVPDGAPLLDRTVGLAGRDPHWRGI